MAPPLALLVLPPPVGQMPSAQRVFVTSVTTSLARPTTELWAKRESTDPAESSGCPNLSVPSHATYTLGAQTEEAPVQGPLSWA